MGCRTSRTVRKYHCFDNPHTGALVQARNAVGSFFRVGSTTTGYTPASSCSGIAAPLSYILSPFASLPP
nr:MAG TPA_asm: hypothetical protein [Caudoviricetes sp.]